MDRESARREVADAARARAGSEPRWRAAILAALAAGVGPTEVAALAGCTRQRVYQIKAKAGDKPA